MTPYQQVTGRDGTGKEDGHGQEGGGGGGIDHHHDANTLQTACDELDKLLEDMSEYQARSERELRQFQEQSRREFQRFEQKLQHIRRIIRPRSTLEEHDHGHQNQDASTATATTSGIQSNDGRAQEDHQPSHPAPKRSENPPPMSPRRDTTPAPASNQTVDAPFNNAIEIPDGETVESMLQLLAPDLPDEPRMQPRPRKW